MPRKLAIFISSSKKLVIKIILMYALNLTLKGKLTIELRTYKKTCIIINCKWLYRHELCIYILSWKLNYDMIYFTHHIFFFSIACKLRESYAFYIRQHQILSLYIPGLLVTLLADTMLILMQICSGTYPAAHLLQVDFYCKKTCNL